MTGVIRILGVDPGSGATGSESDRQVEEGSEDDDSVTTTPPTTATTTTTTLPPGVPDDWPDDRPIPPMPSDCEKPQLEDDGTWNCDH